jgi:uncharacterized protein (TIRG00374 family)
MGDDVYGTSRANEVVYDEGDFADAHDNSLEGVPLQALWGRMKSFILSGAKILLTLGLFALAFRSIDIDDVWLHVRSLPAFTLLMAVILMICQLVISGVRLSAITGIIAAPVPFTTILRINWVGAFFSQALITFVSGDVVRAMMLNRSCGLVMRDSVGAVTLDRIIGLLSSLLIVSITAPWAMRLTGDETMRKSIQLLAAAGVLLVTGFVMVGYLARHPEVVRIARSRVTGSRVAYVVLDLISVARHLFNARRQVPAIFVVSLVIQMINVTVIFLLINGMGADVSIMQCMLIVPTVMLISLLPFSVAGWGLRESAMATGFLLVDAPPAAALAASVTLGVLTLLLALPGGLLWWSSSIIVPLKAGKY